MFAVEGAMAAVNGNLDFIGIMALAFCSALGGGIIRDTLLGALPPAALRDWRYPTIPLSAAVLVFFCITMSEVFLSRTSKYWTPRAWQSLQLRAPRKPCCTK